MNINETSPAEQPVIGPVLTRRGGLPLTTGRAR
jgi:hypothetical protein